MTKKSWDEIRQNLISAVGKSNYTNWIEPLEFARIEGGVAKFHVPTTFMGNWVLRNFGDHILQELTKSGNKVTRVEFAVPDSAKPTRKRAARSQDKPASAVAGQVVGEVPGAPLDARFTFESFVVGKPNELAHAAARRVAKGGAVTFNPLFLYGGVGLGKTHLMHA
ncbi:MAG: chromosomal replication initiator protein DnaA, partial [Boseongicola sp. SB0670_bin_30]|nr:chromosomal replication initiator protein DnaA [Boseongicola sp. SB0670_bin_30]